MVWTLSTIEEEPVNLEVYSGLPLFSTISENSPLPTLILNPQSASFSKKQKATFTPTVINTLPTPTKSKLYILDGIFSCSLEETFNIDLIEPESYFVDLVETKTYILTTNEEIEISRSIELLESGFLRTDTTLSYSFPAMQNSLLEKVTSEGLTYLIGSPGESHAFSFEDYTDLVLYINKFCSPRPGSYIYLEVTNIITDRAESLFDTLIFDLSGTTLSKVDSLTWAGKSFMYSLNIEKGSLLFNRVSKTLVAIC